MDMDLYCDIIYLQNISPIVQEYISTSDAKNKTALEEFVVTLSEASYATFDKVTPYDDIPPEMYMPLLVKLQFPFKPAVSNSGSNKYGYNLQQIVSEMGICYSFNSQLAVYNSPE